MSEKSAGIAAAIAATMLMTVFTTAMTLSMKYAKGQIKNPMPGRDGCPDGYHRSPSGLCVPNTTPPPDTTESRTEENIICSEYSYTCG